ncbi:maleylpyruvate isomerase family mycothiol-dependent enzyme [Solicola gregarius]|uniref:Maleylpyruvate isomerase family mycothiol-dependent enzyme n=1 Tax=Solicola gregarius TaxID=2908642 RepID=A0AA46TL69_9ACTN|nr:maleylpyruvate isomerase family mycothiol-dependent enzyme [Solicola gregarius]UYM07115.1 maleylpyruvate isomerase family mycothiol-dependent enzyme [Solicola gregarius]
MTLQDSVDAWHDCATRVVALLRTLPADAWDEPTDCPRWTVHDVAAHLASIETEIASGVGTEPDKAISDVTDEYTQEGVDARSGVPHAEVVDELERAVEARRAQLDELDVDPDATPERTPGGIGWSWKRLLSNRVVDLWVHEQDIREAVDAPGGTDSAAAAHTVRVFGTALPYVLGKRVAPPPGTSVRWVVSGEVGFDVTIRIGEDGRAHPADDVADPTTRLDLDERAFTRLAAGRRSAADLAIGVGGDAALARRVLDAMSVIG